MTAAAPEPAPEVPDPALVLADGEVAATRAYDGGAIVISFAPGAPLDRAAELRDAMAAQCDVPVFAVADVAAIRTWEPQPAPELAAAMAVLAKVRAACERPAEAVGHTSGSRIVNGDYLARHLLDIIKRAGIAP